MSKSIDPPVEQINAFGDHGPLRRIIAEDPEWSLALVPPLSILCLQNIVTNFEGMLFKGTIDKQLYQLQYHNNILIGFIVHVLVVTMSLKKSRPSKSCCPLIRSTCWAGCPPPCRCTSPPT
jgi:hypothetical protein